MFRVLKSRTTAYHPASNGACERVNRTIKKGLQKSLNGENLDSWDVLLSHVVFAYNTTEHSTTGFTPYFLMFGEEARIPSEFIVGRPPLENTPASRAISMVENLENAYSSVR